MKLPPAKLIFIAMGIFVLVLCVLIVRTKVTPPSPPSFGIQTLLKKAVSTPKVPHDIRLLSELGGRSPVEFLNVLQEEKEYEYIFWAPLEKWISKKDIPALLALANSKAPCASVALAASSYYSKDTSTVGQEALFMLQGYRKGKYPPSLNSVHLEVDEDELIRWCRNEMNPNGKQ